jgi:hypothetical protein
MVEQDGVAGSDAAEPFQRQVVDAGVGLAEPDLAGVDDGVEEGVDVDTGAPERRDLLEVVGDDGRPVTPAAEVGDAVEHALAQLDGLEMGHHRGELERPAPRRALLPGPLAQFGEGALAALEPVERMVLRVVGADEQRGHLGRLRAGGGRDRLEHRAHGCRDDAAEVEQDGLHRRSDGTR